jgi:hypothetical protein
MTDRELVPRRFTSPRGTYIFLRDADSGESWSAGYQPCGGEPDSYSVARSPRIGRKSSAGTVPSRPASK